MTGRPTRSLVTLNGTVTVDLVLKAPFLTDADKRAILGGTLTELLRIAS